MGERWWLKEVMSPVCGTVSWETARVRGVYLICIEDVYGGLSPRPYAIPLLNFRILFPHIEVECVIVFCSTLA